MGSLGLGGLAIIFQKFRSPDIEFSAELHAILWPDPHAALRWLGTLKLDLSLESNPYGQSG